MDKTLISYLEENNINFTIHTHIPVFTVAESKSVREKIPGLHVKNLFLKDEKGNFYLYVCPAEKQANLKALRKFLNVKKIQFGSPEELHSQLKISPGSVSLFCMIYSKDTLLIIDNEVYFAEKAGFHPNNNTATLVLENKDIKKFINSLNKKYLIFQDE